MQRSRLKNIINKSKGISNNPIIGEPFDKFKKSLPMEVDDNYRLEAAWKAYGSPKDYKEALWQGLIQPIDENTLKLPSIGYNEETDEYEYLNKGKENETVDKDIRVWDNDVIPLVKELKLGGYLRVYNEEKDCWTYSKNKPQENQEIDYLQKGKPIRHTNGQKCNTTECAQFSNGELRDSGYMPRGNAWNLQNVDLLYSGYDTNNYPQQWNLQDVVRYNNEASDNFYKNFDSNTLDKDSAYVVNMYYQGSPAQERAYNEGRDKMTGTHTGYVAWNPDTNRWEVTHNIHGTIHVDPFTKIQGGNRKYGITGIFAPRERNILNRVRDILGLGEGGIIENQEAIEQFQKGGKSKKVKSDQTYAEFIATLPANLQKGNDGEDGYRMRYAFDNSPDVWSFDDAKGKFIHWNEQDQSWHGSSTFGPTGEFLKSANHPTTWMEEAAYMSSKPKLIEGREDNGNPENYVVVPMTGKEKEEMDSFRNRFDLVKTDENGNPLKYWRYVPKQSTQAFKQGGKNKIKIKTEDGGFIEVDSLDEDQRAGKKSIGKYKGIDQYMKGDGTCGPSHAGKQNPEAFKQGGQMNVIPEGSLHAHKNHMELAEKGEITPKGIPVIDNDGNQQAEIEKEELTVTKTVTDKLENWYKKYFNNETTQKEKDELAIKCGKFITKEILFNTDDRVGLITKLQEEM